MSDNPVGRRVTVYPPTYTVDERRNRTYPPSWVGVIAEVLNDTYFSVMDARTGLEHVVAKVDVVGLSWTPV